MIVSSRHVSRTLEKLEKLETERGRQKQREGEVKKS